ncbi:MAG: hypothetical protein PSX36_02330 [bacterium]|nr:hypothetical protein [bacterium]
MFAFIARKILRSKIRRNDQKHQKKFLPWEQIEKIALIVGSESILNKSELDTLLNDTHKYIEVFFIEPKSKEPSYGDWQCFLKKDTNFLKLPNHAAEEHIKGKQFDVVINTCPGNNLFAAGIASFLTASFKCAGSRGIHDADLIIQSSDTKNPATLLKDTFHYIKMIHV